MTTVGQSVKEERHDEQEIAELAAKMVEAHKTQAAKQVTQQLNNQALLAQNSLSNIQSGSGSILNYLQRKPTGMAQPIPQQTSTNGNHNGTSSSSTTVDESKPADEESLKGHFGWESFNSGKVHIPYIIRQSEKYCAVRIVEQKLLNKYLNVLHQDLYNCTNIRSYYITEVEARLLDEINYRHCDQCFGKEKFSAKDLIVRLTDAQKFQQFLEVCYRKLTNYSTPNDKCGFIRINSESVVPYTVRDLQKMVPLFYFEGETENLKLKADSLSGWDLSYLKFCCKVQGIRNELFASETVAVISLDDIKSYFPQGTMFEDYWPNKVVDTQLLVAQPKSHGTITWTNPPPKQQVLSMQQQQQQRAPPAQPQPQKVTPQSQQQQHPQQQQQQQQVQQQQQQRSITSGTNAAALQHMYSNSMDMNYLRSMQQSGLTNSQQASLAALAFNGWGNQLTPSQMDMFRLASAQSKQGSTNRSTYSRQQQQQQQHQQQQMQTLLQNPSLYSSYSNSMSMSSNGHSRNAAQQPPPLVRSQQSQMSNCGVSGSATSLASTQQRSSANYSQSSSTSSSYPSYQASSNNVNSSLSKSNNNSVVTITRCPPSNPSNASFPHTNPSSSSSSNYLNRIPASTTITPTQYYNNKDNSLTSSLSVYPKNSQSGSGRNIIQSSVSPVIASPTRASPQAGYAKQPSVSPASPMHSLLPDVIQQQLNELLKTNFPNQNQDLLKETLLSQYSLYARAQQAAAAGNQSSSQNPPSYPIRNKSVITTSRESPMDVIDLSSNSPTPSRSGMSAVQQALELQHAASISAANKRASYNGQYINGNQSSTRSMQSSSSTSNSRLQQQMELNGYGMSAYKVEKAYIEQHPVSVVKTVLAGSLNPESVIPLSELRDQFYPNANLEICRRVLETLGITLIPGNKQLYQAFAIAGKTVQENVPFVRTSDFKAYLVQINYMIRGHLQEYRNTSKRARIS